MSFYQDSPQLVSVAYYRAPKDQTIIPSTILPPRMRIEILTSGKVWFDEGKPGAWYGAGTIFFHQNGQRTVHQTDTNNPYRCISVNLTQAEQATLVFPRISAWTTPETLPIFRREVVSAFHDPECDRSILRDYIWHTLKWHISRSIPKLRAEEIPLAVRRAVNYLEKHSETNISVETLANIAKYSKAHFQGLFKKHMGVTPHRYHLNYRIRIACEKLSSETTGIAEISDTCGFESMENFYRAFKRLRDCTPGDYRKANNPRYWESQA